jgi:hypothetical protein
MIVGLEVEPKEAIVEVRVLRRAGHRHGMILAKIDLEAIKKHRIERLRARRPELYSRL